VVAQQPSWTEQAGSGQSRAFGDVFIGVGDIVLGALMF
jgi:hypothetical protein